LHDTPREYSAKVLQDIQVLARSDGETIVVKRCPRKNLLTGQLEHAWCPVVAIEELVPTIEKHFDGATGINNLYHKVGRAGGRQAGRQAGRRAGRRLAGRQAGAVWLQAFML
jgi:hypothetical protein